MNDEVFEKHIRSLLSYVPEDKHSDFYLVLGKYVLDMCELTLDEFINALKKGVQDNPVKYYEPNSEDDS